MAFWRRCLSDKKVRIFSEPFWPPLTQGAQRFQGKVFHLSPIAVVIRNEKLISV